MDDESDFTPTGVAAESDPSLAVAGNPAVAGKLTEREADENDVPARDTVNDSGAPEPFSPPHESKSARARRLKRPPGRPRNPSLEFRFKPTREHRELVQTMIGYAIPLERIALVIRNPATRRPIAVSTLLKRFPQEIAGGRAALEGLLCTMLTHRIRNGDLTAIIRAQKNLMGWTDRREVHRFGVDVNVKLDGDELVKELLDHSLPLSVFGADVPKLDAPKLIEGNGSSEPDDDAGTALH